MKLKDIGKRITALPVCCLVCVVTAAAVSYSSWTGTVTGKHNITYHGQTSINTSDEKELTGEEIQSDYDVSGLTSGELLLLCQDNRFLSGINKTEIDGIQFLSEDMQIHINETGNTYGEALFVKHAGLAVDLISAVGKNGVTGYIWRFSLPCNNPNYVPVNHTYEVPVYANDGVTVIDSMLVGSDNTTDVDVTE